MIIEIKIFLYWLALVAIFGLISFIEYVIDGGGWRYPYYDGFFTNIFRVIWILGLIVIGFYLFALFTNYFFTGEWIRIYEIS